MVTGGPGFICVFFGGVRCFWDPRGGGPRIFELPDSQIGLKGPVEMVYSHGNESNDFQLCSVVWEAFYSQVICISYRVVKGGGVSKGRGFPNIP